MTSDLIWKGDWRERVVDRIRALGFASVRDYSRARPVVTFDALCRELGADIAPAQVESVFYEEALLGDYLLDEARAGLARELRRYLPEGFPSDSKPFFPASQAFATWVSALPDEYSDVASRVWECLRSAAGAGWSPDSPEDPTLVEAFRDTGDDWAARHLRREP